MRMAEDYLDNRWIDSKCVVALSVRGGPLKWCTDVSLSASKAPSDYVMVNSSGVGQQFHTFQLPGVWHPRSHVLLYWRHPFVSTGGFLEPPLRVRRLSPWWFHHGGYDDTTWKWRSRS